MKDTKGLFLAAAASYFGLPLEQLQEGSEIDASSGAFEVVLRVALNPDDISGIAGRMKALQEAQANTQQEEMAPSSLYDADLQELRQRYTVLTAAEKSRFGSFSRFVAWDGKLPEAEEMRSDYVARTVAATKGLSAIEAAVLGGGLKKGDPLPAEVAERLQRLSGADGKPTSNADDFGGVPG